MSIAMQTAAVEANQMPQVQSEVTSADSNAEAEKQAAAPEAAVEAAVAKPAAPATTITISESAAKAIQAQRIKRGTPDAAIRVGIRGGGCTGFSYMFEWDDKEPKKTDKVFTEHGVVLFVDRKSFVYLRGTELDFVTSMMGHGFKFNNPNAKGSCGCGESVQF